MKGLKDKVAIVTGGATIIVFMLIGFVGRFCMFGDEANRPVGVT